MRGVAVRMLLVACACMSIGRAQAQQVADCAALMKHGIYDRYKTLSTRDQFRATQEFFRSFQFSSKEQATRKAGDLGLRIEDVINLQIGGQSSARNFEAWRSELLKATFEVAEQHGLLTSSVEQISSRIADLVQTCLTQKGPHLYLVPGNDARTFTVSVDYQPSSDRRASTRGVLTIAPPTVAATCSPKGLLGKKLDIGPQGTSLACTRLPSDTVTVIANLDDGTHTIRYDAFVPPPVYARCTLDSPSIPYGGTAILSWETRNATKVELGAGDGPLEEVQASEHRTVSPLATTEYRLVATSQQGRATTTRCRLEVLPKPPVLISASTHFRTSDNDKDDDTFVGVSVLCGGAVVANGGGTYGHFDDHSDNGWHGLNVQEPRKKSEVVGACSAQLNERPNGHDEWHFDWSIELKFSDDSTHRVSTSCNVDHDRPNCSMAL